MTKKQHSNRTQLTDLAVAEQELTEQEMAQVQGGTSNLNLSKSNIPVGGLPPAPPAPIDLSKAADPKKDKDKLK